MTIVFTCSLGVIHQVVGQHIHFFALAGCGVEPHFSFVEFFLIHLISLHALYHRFRSNSERTQLRLSQLNIESSFARCTRQLISIHLAQTLLGSLVCIEHTSLASDFVIVQLCFIVWLACKSLVTNHFPCRKRATHEVESHIIQANPVGTLLLHVETDFQLSVVHNRIDVHRIVDVNLRGSHQLLALTSIEIRTANGGGVSQSVEMIDT